MARFERNASPLYKLVTEMNQHHLQGKEQCLSEKLRMLDERIAGLEHRVKTWQPLVATFIHDVSEGKRIPQDVYEKMAIKSWEHSKHRGLLKFLYKIRDAKREYLEFLIDELGE